MEEEVAPSPPRESLMTDQEITHSSRSVDWQITLQQNLRPSPPSEPSPQEDEEEVDEDIQEQSQLE